MSVILVILGLILLVIVSSDVVVTTLTGKGGGFLTNRVSSRLWQSTIELHKYKTNHRLLAWVGLLLLMLMVASWFLLTWVAWSLIFCSFQDAVVNASNQQPASTWGRIYFTGYTITTLGRGDYQPAGTIWHLFTSLAAANGFFLVTLSIAYLFPVVSALTQKKSVSTYIAALGGTADDILIRCWNGKDFGNLYQHLISLTPMIAELGEKHLTYPILYYFHSNERSRSFTLSMAALDEAMTLLQYAVLPDYRPDAAALAPARRASSAFLRTLKSAYLKSANYDPPLTPLKLLREKGIPVVSDREFIEATKCVTQRRRFLLALVKNDGWSWDAVASSHTTSRANHLDDRSAIEDLVLH